MSVHADRTVAPQNPLIEAAAAIRAGTLSARALAEAHLARIAVTDPALRAWETLDANHVRRCADACDHASDGGLRGIGVGVKDIIDTAELPTQMGTPLHAQRRSATDADCIVRLKAAGGYVFGKTVTTEFAFMQPAATRNPWDLARTPGGSSSGSAAAVAAGHVTAALGTQTNGSVIRPAAYCGVVGFKPTFGALPNSGIHVFSETLDTVGTFTRSVADAALLAGALAQDGRVAMRIAPLRRPPTLALLSSYPWCDVTPDVATALDAAALRLRARGASLEAVAIDPPWHDAHRAMRTIMLHEAARNLGKVQGRDRARLSSDLNAALDEGAAIGIDRYREALAYRARALEHFRALLAPFDALLSPPAPAVAPVGLQSTGDPSCCTLWSFTGFPALALPIGLDRAGVPLGVQLAAVAERDNELLSAAAWCEQAWSFAAAPTLSKGVR